MNLLTNITNERLEPLRDKLLAIEGVQISDKAYSLTHKLLKGCSAIFCEDSIRLLVLNIISPETFPL